MVNVADDLVGRGVIARGDGVWRVDGDADQLVGVPEGLKPLIDRQLERVPEEDQRLLEAASVAGRVFSVAAVAAALETTPDAVDERCEQFGRRGVFIEEAAGLASQYAFLHDLYQRALYDRLSTSRRARLHRRIAEFEVQASADQVRERAAQLAVHFERGGDPAGAIAHVKQAATNALRRQAFQEAIDLLQHALMLLATLPPSTERDEKELGVQTLLAQPLMMAKGYAAPEVAVVAARAREISQRLEQTPALLPALLGMARLHCTRAEIDDAAALGEQCVTLSLHAPDPLPLMTDSVMVYVSYFRCEMESARAHAERGAATYDLARHRSIALAYGDDPGIMCLGFGASALWCLGYADQARTKIAAALELARRLEIPYCQALALDLSTWVHLFAHDHSAATESLDALEALAARHGFPMFVAHSLGLRGWLLLEQARAPSTAIQLLEQGLAVQALTGVQITTPWLMASLSEALAADGQTTRARDVVDDAISLTTRTGMLMDMMQALTVKGDLCAAVSEDDEAVACFEKAIALARRQAAKSMELRAATRLARLRQRQGKVAEARALIGDVYGWFTEGFDTPDLRDARALIESLDKPVLPARRKARRSTAAT